MTLESHILLLNWISVFNIIVVFAMINMIFDCAIFLRIILVSIHKLEIYFVLIQGENQV